MGAAIVGYGALAPPLEPTPPEEDFSVSEVFSLEAFSEDSPPADVPPAAPLPEEPEPLSSEELSPPDSLPPVEPEVDSSPVVGVVDVLAVVDVEVVSLTSFSAEVLFGG